MNPFNKSYSTKENFFQPQPKHNPFESHVKSRPLNSNISTAESMKHKSILCDYDDNLGEQMPYRKYQKINFNGGFPMVRESNPFKNVKKNKGNEEKNEEISHKYIPPELRNNEVYKNLLCKKVLKNPKYKTNKTYTKKDFLPIEENKRKDQFSLLTKRRKISELQTVYSGKFDMINNQGETEYHSFFRDEDCGMGEEWQQYLIETRVDEDVETDDDMLPRLDNVIHSDLKEAIKQLKNGEEDPKDILFWFPGNN